MVVCSGCYKVLVGPIAGGKLQTASVPRLRKSSFRPFSGMSIVFGINVLG